MAAAEMLYGMSVDPLWHPSIPVQREPDDVPQLAPRALAQNRSRRELSSDVNVVERQAAFADDHLEADWKPVDKSVEQMWSRLANDGYDPDLYLRNASRRRRMNEQRVENQDAWGQRIWTSSSSSFEKREELPGLPPNRQAMDPQRVLSLVFENAY